MQVPTEYVHRADVQIAWPDERAAKQSKIAIATGTGLCDARACPEGDCSSPGHYLDRNHSTRDDRREEQELAR